MNQQAAPAAAPPGPNLRANGESRREDQFLSPRVMQREAAKILNARGLEVRPAALRRLITRFIQSGITTLAELEAHVISYADPTGETAVRNVMRGQARV